MDQQRASDPAELGGEARPRDGDGTATDDIGALEIESPPPPPHFTVNETGDAGDADISDDRCDVDSSTTGRQCTLRAAIEEANDTFEADTIDFDIGGTGSAKSISLNSALPTIAGTLTIDGYTQEDASRNTLEEGNDAVLNVVIGGLSVGAGEDGLEIEANNCMIKGLVIRNFDGYGIEIIGGTGTRIEGNFIGTTADGTSALGNAVAGADVSGADDNAIGGLRRPRVTASPTTAATGWKSSARPQTTPSSPTASTPMPNWA